MYVKTLDHTIGLIINLFVISRLFQTVGSLPVRVRELFHGVLAGVREYLPHYTAGGVHTENRHAGLLREMVLYRLSCLLPGSREDVLRAKRRQHDRGLHRRRLNREQRVRVHHDGQGQRRLVQTQLRTSLLRRLVVEQLRKRSEQAPLQN